MTSTDIPRLEVVSGPASGARLDLGDEPLEFGREAEAEGQLGGDPELSRRHARVSGFDRDRLLVEDLGSTNGTLVNGEQIAAPTVLSAGDTVEVGATKLRVIPASTRLHGGVHRVPSNLLSVLAARAPVKREWVLRTALTVIPIVLAINFTIRALAINLFDVKGDIGTLKPPILAVISMMPVIAESFGFYKSFGRPTDHSIFLYLIPAFAITPIACTGELTQLPAGSSTAQYVFTVLVAIVAPSIILPAVLALRVRAKLTAARELGLAADPETGS
jgi:pSer/pThr/pTyr-binding forkhead associated (FHA) protein